MEVKGYPKVRVAEVKKAGKRVNSSLDEGKSLIKERIIQERQVRCIWKRNDMDISFYMQELVKSQLVPQESMGEKVKCSMKEV